MWSVTAVWLVVTVVSAVQADAPEPGYQSDDGDYKVVCYYPNWSQYRPPGGTFGVANIDPYLCTHILYAFAKIVDNDLDIYEPNDHDMYQELNQLKRFNPALKTMLSVGGATMGTEPFIRVSSTPENREEFSVNVAAYLREFGFDGVDIDWEFPRSQDKHIHKELMQTLSLTFMLESLASGEPPLLLSGALGAGRSHIFNSYDLPEIARCMDFANVMTYDLHGGWDSVTGFHSALHGYYPGDEFAQDWVVESYISQGFPPEKMVLGIPAYGRSFALCNPWENDVRDCSQGYGEPGPYTRADGILAYYEICAELGSTFTRQYDSMQEVPYAHGADQWVGYDDVRSIRAKARFVDSMSLAGVMFWDISMDDFDDMCGDGPFPLINAAKPSSPGTTREELPSTPDPMTTRRTPPTSRPPHTTPDLTPPTHWPPHTTPDRTPPTSRPRPTRPSAGPTEPPVMTTRILPGLSCEGVDDLAYYRSPYDCSVFYQCVSMVAYRFECPPGLYFDVDVNVCNWDYLVDC